MQQRRVSNVNYYNDDDGRQTFKRNYNFIDYEYNDGHLQQTTRPGFTMSFRDIADSLRSFDGTNV